MQGNRIQGWRRLLAAAAVGLAWLASPSISEAGVPAAVVGPVQHAVQGADAGLVEPVLFWHRRQQPQELYCVEGRYWWYYRPYQGSHDYARCMPYFHYPERPAGQYAPAPGGLK
ncbi:hypothetical protein A7A08_00103 [Methyloligella halotolerans]|uniref:YARHG domain-containing protein n=1 Tax=Methyloligella halotolerans TaxID=1177755 RepID=A0A1E2S1T1_9HYPH|nr:hypothetical protein [Methyloligella halotolerans]ODA68285.1 hypothetical protein A7A08_00103 [Methyloligella halotolerans]